MEQEQEMEVGQEVKVEEEDVAGTSLTAGPMELLEVGERLQRLGSEIL